MSTEQQEAGARHHLRDRMVAASDGRDLSVQLQTYGPIEAADVPFLADKARSFRANVRHNAVQLLAIARVDSAIVALRKLAAETADVYVYAVALQRMLEVAPDPVLARSRPELLHKALQDPDAKVVAAALKAGTLAKLPGIEAELDRRLADPDIKVRGAVLEALGDCDPGPLSGKLIDLLFHPPADLHSLSDIYRALSLSDDPTMADVLRKAAVDPKIRSDLGTGVRLSHSRKPWLRALLLEWLRGGEPWLHKKAFQILDGWEDPALRRELVQLCAQHLEGAPPTGDSARRAYLVDHDYYRRFLGQLAGRADGIFGVDDDEIAAAREFANKWLHDNP